LVVDVRGSTLATLVKSGRACQIESGQRGPVRRREAFVSFGSQYGIRKGRSSINFSPLGAAKLSLSLRRSEGGTSSLNGAAEMRKRTLFPLCEPAQMRARERERELSLARGRRRSSGSSRSGRSRTKPQLLFGSGRRRGRNGRRKNGIGRAESPARSLAHSLAAGWTSTSTSRISKGRYRRRD